MSTLEYVTGLVLATAVLALIVATPFGLVHARTTHDHGPDCWWCHPRLLPRKKR